MMCSDDAMAKVWEAYHAQRGDTVRVPRAEVWELFQCGGMFGQTLDEILVHGPSSRRTKFVLCHRAPLFAFLKEHQRSHGGKSIVISRGRT
jgi:hypothetical protein